MVRNNSSAESHSQLELFPPAKPRRARQNVRVGSYRVVVKPVWRKEPDVDKLTAALLRIIEQENRTNKKTKRKRAA